jgi:hypothetical protein
MFWDNKRRDRVHRPVDEKRGAEVGMLDITEVSLIKSDVSD